MSAPGSGRLCLFAKPPVAGSAKTRLAPAVGAEGAATLADAFLRDSWATCEAVPWARAILATTGELPVPGEAWLQGDGDLGARLERILARALTDAPFAVALGADSPGLPARLLELANEALSRNDAVLGPAEDGGFYLLGLRRCPEGLLAGLPWSEPVTFERTVERLTSSGLTLEILPRWFDVDGPDDLLRLARLLASGEVTAPRTARALAALGVAP